jgi:predicted choloylglycine hydrolase
MPELLPLYERLVDLAGGGDHAARFLAMYCPPPYLSGCSQAVWTNGEPVLVRNYDYHPDRIEGALLRTAWHGRPVLAMSDCLWGVLDGINGAGLALSLSFGGRKVVGQGFGVPLVLRYILEFCTRTAEAIEVLKRVPIHMSYNVTIVDALGTFETAFLAPDRPIEVTTRPVATNHQFTVEWHEHANATASVEREAQLLHCLVEANAADQLVEAFLHPPLYSRAYARGFGTLYTAAYWPTRRSGSFRWPGIKRDFSLEMFVEGIMEVDISERSPASGGSEDSVT